MPQPHETTAGYLAALASHLHVEPTPSAAKAHVYRAASEARGVRARWRHQVTRLSLTALALTTVISTSGVAAAGHLPPAMQGIVADAARLMPVPLPIPYPDPSDPVTATTLVELETAEHYAASGERIEPAPEQHVEAEELSQTAPETSDSNQTTGSGFDGDDRHWSDDDRRGDQTDRNEWDRQDRDHEQGDSRGEESRDRSDEEGVRDGDDSDGRDHGSDDRNDRGDGGWDREDDGDRDHGNGDKDHEDHEDGHGDDRD